MMVQVFKSAVGHSIFGGSVIMHWQAQWIWTWKKLQCLTVKSFVFVLCCVIWLASMFNLWKKEAIDCIYTYKFYVYINIYKHFGQISDSREHTTSLQVARNMMLRSTDHVCKCKERYHPHPTPPQPHPSTCVASTKFARCKEHDVA